MNTLETYILNIFSTLPNTDQIEKLKEELLANMEEKYEELKELGKSEADAISIVISEFGDIDELLLELNVKEKNSEPELEKSAIINYFDQSKKSFRKIGYGIFLTFFGISIAYLVYELLKNNLIFSYTETSVLYLVPLFSLLVFLIPSLYIFISEGLNFDKLNKIKTTHYKLSEDAKAYLHSEYELFKPKFTKKIILGIILILSSSISLAILKTNVDMKKSLATFVFLLLIGVSVMIFINIGTYYSDLKFFMVIKEYLTKNADVNRVLAAVAAFIFPITLFGCLFLIIFYKKWVIAITIFFAVSIIYGAFAGAYSTMKQK